MVGLYAKRIIRGVMTLEEVPSLWRERVAARLKELGYAC